MLGPGPGADAPSGAQVGRNLVKRVLVPSIVLWVVVAGIGYLIVDVFQLDEHAVNAAFVDARTERWDAITSFMSSMGNTQILMATCAVIVLFMWWQSRQWWLAVVPALSLSVQVSIFLTTSLLIGRERPDVEQLDHAAPTSSFPSGHAGATTSTYLAVALCASRIQNAWLRITVQVVCVLIPLGVVVARVYRGMHHPTDVVAGFLIGATCAIIAWNWLPARPAPGPTAGARLDTRAAPMR